MHGLMREEERKGEARERALRIGWAGGGGCEASTEKGCARGVFDRGGQSKLVGLT